MNLPLRVAHIAQGRALGGGRILIKIGLTEVTFYHRALWSQNHCLESFHSKATPNECFWEDIVIPVLVCYCCLWRPWDNCQRLAPECQSPVADQRRLWFFHVLSACVLPSFLGKEAVGKEKHLCISQTVSNPQHFFSRGKLVDMTYSERIIEPKVSLQDSDPGVSMASA